MTTSNPNVQTAQLEIINKLGLHARACGKLIEVTTPFKSSILIGREDSLVDAKNIMSLLMLGAGKGTVLNAMVEGEDAVEALNAVQQLFSQRFLEAE